MAKEEVKKWKDRLTCANRKHDKEVKDQLEKRRKYYRGQQWNNSSAEAYNDKTVDNMVFSNIKTIMPAINFNNPRIYAKAKKKPYKTDNGVFDTLAAAVGFEILMDYDYRHLEIKKQVDKCLLDALLGPWGIMQLGYTVETEKVDMGEDDKEEDDNVPRGTKNKKKKNEDKKQEVNELIKSESPFVLRFSPADFRVDPECKDHFLRDAKWIAFKWTKPLDKVKSDPKFENTRLLEANGKAETDYDKFVQKTDNTLLESADFDRVVGWDIWDKESNRLYTVVDNHDKFLRDTPWPLELDSFPIEILYFNENPDELYPVSDVDIYMKAQDELNRIRSMQLTHIRNISNRKYLSRENSFSEEEKRKLRHGPDGTIVDCKTDPTTALFPLKDATISQDLYIVGKNLKEDIREVSGIPQFEKGMAQKFDTATEPALMAQNLSVRRAERMAILEDFIIRIVGKLARIRQQTLDTISVPLSPEQFDTAQGAVPDKLEQIIGRNNAMMLQPWLNVEKEDIAGDYEFTVALGSTQPVNSERRKADAVTLYNLMKDNPYVNGYEGTRKVLDSFDEKESDKLLKPQEAVKQEQEQAQKAAKQAEIEKDLPKRQVDMQKTQIKSQTAITTALIKAGGGGGRNI